MATHVLELAIFKVKPDLVEHLTAIRQGVRTALQSFPGLIEFQGYCPADSGVFADVVKWASKAEALAAATAFEQGDPRFLPYMNAIEEVVFMGHFIPEAH